MQILNLIVIILLSCILNISTVFANEHTHEQVKSQEQVKSHEQVTPIENLAAKEISEPIALTSHTSHTSHQTVSQETRQKQLQAITSFEANGKVSFTHGNKGGNATFEWNQSQNHYSILLAGALGIAAVRINNDGKEICLTTSQGEKHVANSAEQLIKQTLGWDIPVTPLIYWLRGIPAPGIHPSHAMLDKYDHLVLLEQQGWKITYQAYMNVRGVDLPQKILLEHGPVRVRFIFKKWNYK